MLNCLKNKFGFMPAINHELGLTLESETFATSVLATETNILEMDHTLDRLYPDVSSYVFLSRHRSESGLPALTSHSTGNFGKNEFGGKPKELAIAYPSLQKQYMEALAVIAKDVPGYDIIIEATHHGPTSLNKPAIFLELGSSPQQWVDENAALTVCRTALSVLKNEILPCAKVAIGFGGTHYPSKLNQLLLESDIGFAAIASKHNLESIDEKMLNQMIARSAEKVTYAVVDVKGLRGHRARILQIIEQAGLHLIEV